MTTCQVHEMEPFEVVREDSGEVVMSYSKCRICGFCDGFDPPDEYWREGTTECRICGYVVLMFWPESADESALKCGNCGNETCEPCEADDP